MTMDMSFQLLVCACNPSVFGFDIRSLPSLSDGNLEEHIPPAFRHRPQLILQCLNAGG